MKSLSKLTLAVLFTFSTTAAFTQTSKPRVFADYPNTIHCSTVEFTKAFAAAEGQHIILSFSNNFRFSGTVLTNMYKYGNLQTMTIKSDNLENTIFHLSRQMLDNSGVTYVGRIISPMASDGYTVQRDAAGNYNFEKIESEKILQECNL